MEEQRRLGEEPEEILSSISHHGFNSQIFRRLGQRYLDESRITALEIIEANERFMDKSAGYVLNMVEKCGILNSSHFKQYGQHGLEKGFYTWLDLIEANNKYLNRKK